MLAAFAALAIAPHAPLYAQPSRRVGMLTWRGSLVDRDAEGGRELLAALARLGFVEGRDFAYEERHWNHQDEAPRLARELIALKPDVIVAAGPPSIVAIKAATDRVPIVMMYSAEPVAMGIVRSLNRPGGNITGLTWDHGFETNVKALELLKEALPNLRRVALIWDATDPAHPIYARYYERAAPHARLEMIGAPVRRIEDVPGAMAEIGKRRADALVILPSGQLTVPKRVEILELAMKERLPTLYAYVGRDAPNALLHHGPNLSRMPARAAAFVDRILKGASAGDLPVEQPDKYDVVVDLRTASKLGLKVPQLLLARADRVIE